MALLPLQDASGRFVWQSFKSPPPSVGIVHVGMTIMAFKEYLPCPDTDRPRISRHSKKAHGLDEHLSESDVGRGELAMASPKKGNVP